MTDRLIFTHPYKKIYQHITIEKPIFGLPRTLEICHYQAFKALFHALLYLLYATNLPFFRPNGGNAVLVLDVCFFAGSHLSA